MLTSKKRRAIAATTALISAVTVLSVSGASASHPEESLTGSNFEIDTDANLRLDDPVPSIDWASITEIRGIDVATGPTDDSYEGGVKEDDVCPGEVTGSIPNNKSDLLTFHAYRELGPGGTPGFFNFAWSRVPDPSGTTLLDFEFNRSATPCPQGPNVVRTVGDLLVEYSITQGGATAVITGRAWTGTAWSDPIVLSDPSPLCGGNPCAVGTINTSPIPAAESDGLITSGSMEPRTFGEAQLDLRFLQTPGTCARFGSMMVKSRASASFTTQLKDFIRPVSIAFDDCGQVTIRKETLPDEDPNVTLFSYDSNIVNDPALPEDFQLTDDGVMTFPQVVQGTYFVNELIPPPDGWEFVSLNCSASSADTAYVVTGTQVDFTIDSPDDTLDCTYTNRPLADLHFTKVAERDDGTVFDYTTTGGLLPPTFSLVNGQTQDYPDLVPSTYGATETVPVGWNLVSQDCTNGDTADAVTLVPGDDVTCTFVNEIERGALVIHKDRKHAAAGGTAPHPEVTFTVTNDAFSTTGVTDINGNICIEDLPASSIDGEYTITETLPSGYHNASLTQQYTVLDGTDCATATPATFVNTPLTNVTVSVDSQIDGGTASTIECNGSTASTGPNGDGSLLVPDLEAPTTLVCTVVIDP